MKTNTLRKARNVLIPLSIGVLLAALPFIYLQTKNSQQVSAGWFNENWLYRKPITVTYTGTENLTEYQVFLDGLDTATLISNKQLQNDCDDLRFTSAGGTRLPYFIVGGTCNSTDTEIYVKTDSIPASNITFYMYYGNPLARAGNDEMGTFSYTTEKTVGYVLSNTFGNLSIMSLADNNTVTHNSNSASLNFGDTTTLADLQYADIKAKSLFNTSGGVSNVNFINPVSWAGTSFSFYTRGTSNKNIYLLSPWGDSDVTLYDDGTAETGSVCGTTLSDPFTLTDDVGTSLVCSNAQIAGGSNVRIEVANGDPPILVYVDEGGGPSDQRPVYPGTTESLYGFASQTGYITAGGTSGDYYYLDRSDTSETGPTSISASSSATVSGTSGFNNTDNPFRIRGTSNISVSSSNDGNGTAATTFVPRKEFGTLFGSANDTTFIAFVSNQTATCSSYRNDDLIEETETLNSSNGLVYGHPNSTDFNTRVTPTSYLNGGWYARCDKPVYAYWQIDDTDYDEQNLMSSPMMRQFTYPTPTPSSPGAEEKAPGPALFWKFDEGTDNTCQGGLADTCDSTNNRNDGVLTGATWQTADKCISGKCLYFDGTNDAVSSYNNTTSLLGYWTLDEGSGTTAFDNTGNKNDLTANTASWTTSGKWNGAWDGNGSKWLSRADDADFDFTDSQNFAISFWFKSDSATNPGSTQYFIDKESGSPGYALYVNTAGWVCFGIDDDGSSFPEATSCFASDIYDNTWHHVYAEKNDTTSIQLYVDGVSVASTLLSVTGTTGSLVNTDDLTIGAQNTSGTAGFAGDMDEVKFFSTALTDTQILADYNTSRATSRLTDFGYYLANGYTFETWFKASSDGENNSGEIFDKGTNTYARVTNEGSDNLGDLEVKIALATTNAAEIIPNAVTLNQWHHLAIGYTDDGDDELTVYLDGKQIGSSADGDGNATAGSGSPATDGNDLLLGGDSANNFHGFIDEFKIYPYERTLEEVQTDFLKNSSKSGSSTSAGYKPTDFLTQNLAGYWTFDESSGDATDASGNGSTLTNVSSTAYVSGKFSNALDPDGSADYMYVNDNTDLSMTGSLTLSAWVNPDSVSGVQTLAGKLDGSNQSYALKLNGGNVIFLVGGASNYVETTSAVISTGSYYHIVGVYISTSQQALIFVNGRQIATTTTGTIPTSLADTSTSFSVGATSAPSEYFNGKIDDLRLYSRALTSNEVTSIYEWSPSTTSYAVKPNLTARWKLDDGYGDTAQDSIGNLDGDLNGACPGSGTCPAWVSGKIGRALSFDGGDSVVITDNASLDITGDFSLTAWIYLDSLISTTKTVVSKRSTVTSDGGYSIAVGTSGEVYCQTANASTTTNSYTANGLVTIGSWYHVGIVRDGSRCDVYVNGAKKTISEGSHSSMTANSLDLTIGASPSSSEYLTGDIDDVQLYSTALSPAEIATIYNGLSAVNVGFTGNTETYSDIDIPSANVMGYWNFDENTGSTGNDLSGLANNLTITSGSWTGGKFGSAVDFNGSSTVVSKTDDADLDFGTGSFTVSAWAKHDGAASAEQYIVAKADGTNGGYKLYMDASGDFCFAIDDDSSWGPDYAACTTNVDYDDNKWHHVVGQKNGTTEIMLFVDGYLAATVNPITNTTATLSNGGTFYIGVNSSGSANYWDGAIDEVKISNTLATNYQLANLYDGQNPLIWWKMDECTGNIAYDSGPYKMNGTLNIGASGITEIGDCVTSSTMRGDAENGKSNAALSFDGTDDYVTVADASTFDTDLTEVLDLPDSGDFSISGWFYRDTFTSDHVILAKRNGLADTDDGYIVYIDDNASGGGNDLLVFEASESGGSDEYSITTSMSFGSSAWTHFVIVWDDDNAANTKVYINGLNDASASKSGTLANIGSLTNSVALSLGSESDGGTYFDGKLDDIRIYPYALSNTQVKKLYAHSDAD